MLPIYYTRYLYILKGDCNLDKVGKHCSTLFNIVAMVVHQHCWNQGLVYFYLRQTSKKARKRVRYGLRSEIALWVRVSALQGAFSIGEMEKREPGL